MACICHTHLSNCIGWDSEQGASKPAKTFPKQHGAARLWAYQPLKLVKSCIYYTGPRREIWLHVVSWLNVISYLILVVRLVRGCHLLRAVSQKAKDANIHFTGAWLLQSELVIWSSSHFGSFELFVSKNEFKVNIILQSASAFENVQRIRLKDSNQKNDSSTSQGHRAVKDSISTFQNTEAEMYLFSIVLWYIVRQMVTILHVMWVMRFQTQNNNVWSFEDTNYELWL